MSAPRIGLDAALSQALSRACDRQVAPGFACAVLSPHHDIQLFQGRHSFEPEAPEISPQSLWDIASLTKIIGTFTCYQKLAETGRITAHTRLGDLLACQAYPDKAGLLITDLLAHRAGFFGAIDYFKTVTNKDAMRAAVFQTNLVRPAGGLRVYDDASYILLGYALEQLFEAELPQVFHDQIFTPLGMKETLFTPSKKDQKRAVPTEWVDALDGVAQGVVHDDNTRIMGGAAGHAGLFATLPDLRLFCQAALRKAPASGDFALENHRYNDTTGTYTIGWDIFNPRTMPSRASTGWLSHTGFTGTMLSVSPMHKAAVVLLSNRVYPKREDNSGINALRRDVLDLVIQSLG